MPNSPVLLISIWCRLNWSSAFHPAQPQIPDAGLCLVLSKGRRISITTGFDAATLVRLVAVLDEA